MRMGKCSIKESFVRITNDEVMIYGMHISPYEKGNIFNKDPLRERKLLMHRYEINKLKGKIQEKGYTLVPLQVYFKGKSRKKWRLVSQEVRSSTISVLISRRRIREESWRRNSR